MWGIVIRLGILALGAAGLASCASDDKSHKDGDGNGSIDPLDKPPPQDTTPPQTPRGGFGNSTPDAPGCFPRLESLQVLFDMKGAFHKLVDGTQTTPADGCFSMAVDRETLCFTGEDCVDNLPQAQQDYLAAGTTTLPRFVAKAKWVSMPVEVFTESPGAVGYGLMAARTQARSTGEPLKKLRRPISEPTEANPTPPTFSWGDVYPTFKNTVGFIWPVEGVYDPTTCHITMTFRTTVKTIDGYGETLPYVALPYYTPNGAVSCVAKKDFSNEGLVIHEGPITVSFTAPDEEVSVCEGAACIAVESLDVNVPSNPQSIKATFIAEEFTPTTSGN